MDHLTVDAVYGEGLFEAASDLGNIEGIGRELEDVVQALLDFPAFFEILKTPTLSGEEKKAAAREVFGGRVADALVNFLCILIDRRRIGRIHGIAKVYSRLFDEREGIVKGEIYSAVELSAEQCARFEEETGRLLKKRVKLQNRTDASLLGGICIYVDGKMIDASVRSRLNSLKERIMQ